MQRIAEILRPVIVFVWIVPGGIWLGQRFEGTWPGYVAYITAGIAAIAALAAGWLAYRKVAQRR